MCMDTLLLTFRRTELVDRDAGCHRQTPAQFEHALHAAAGADREARHGGFLHPCQWSRSVLSEADVVVVVDGVVGVIVLLWW